MYIYMQLRSKRDYVVGRLRRFFTHNIYNQFE